MNSLELGKKRAEELLGCIVHFGSSRGDDPGYYRANDIHRLLGEGVDTTGRVYKGKHCGFGVGVSTSMWPDAKSDDLSALLIGIRPIVQESEERKLLRRLANARLVNVGVQHEMFEILAEARRLLEGEK